MSTCARKVVAELGRDQTKCGSQDSEAHHPDYGQPMLVTWLCKTHHTQEHFPLRAIQRYEAIGNLEPRKPGPKKGSKYFSTFRQVASNI